MYVYLYCVYWHCLPETFSKTFFCEVSLPLCECEVSILMVCVCVCVYSCVLRAAGVGSVCQALRGGSGEGKGDESRL